MAHTREKSKGRKESGAVAVIPHRVLNHPDFLILSSSAIRLLLELVRQYNGHSNNGDLTAAWAVMRHRGFNSPTTLSKAVSELLKMQFIQRTREGRFINPGKQCALYALAWKSIDECLGKYLEVAPTLKPSRAFSAEVIKMPSTETVSTGYRNRIDGDKKNG